MSSKRSGVRQNSPTSSVIERLRRQQKQMIKLIVAFIATIIIGVAVPEAVKTISILQNSPVLKVLGILWGCLIGVVSLILIVAAILNGNCPACGAPLGEEFWIANYCPRCGAKLSENA